MCGIFALLCSSDFEVDRATLEAYSSTGKKRGPEHSSFHKMSNAYNFDLYFGFHRLAINGLDEISHQPIVQHPYSVICNGEIYNAPSIFKAQDILPKTNSDCEAILALYERNERLCVNALDGVFAFVLYDEKNNQIMVARDPYGVRPLYECIYDDDTIGFASDIQPLLMSEHSIKYIRAFPPGSYAIYKPGLRNWVMKHQERYYFNTSYLSLTSFGKDREFPIEYYMYTFVEKLKLAIHKRVQNCERDIACLLSGGLDSSIISAYVSRYYKEKTGGVLQTYSIGLEGSEDLRYAKQVADHIGSLHTSVQVTNEDFIHSIPHVIQDIESYDTTTVRASVGNWNMGKYIACHSSAKVIFNGDGADELMGGYMYFHCCPTNKQFDEETRRLLAHIHRFDVLRSDKSISSHGLEPRTPFLDKELTRFYLSIPVQYRNHNSILGKKRCEKYFTRKAIEEYDPSLLPKEILWRQKEAFSDGVSSQQKSWYEVIQDHVQEHETEKDDESPTYEINPPTTPEQRYYRREFRKHFPPCCDALIPYFWMPKFIEGVTDASARSLSIYNEIKSRID